MLLLLASVFVFVLVFVVTLFFNDVQFDGIESNHLQFRSTFLTTHDFALVRVQINVDISIAFRASSGRHSFILPALSEGRDSPVVGRAPLPCKQPKQSTRERWNLQHSFSLRFPSRSLRLCVRNTSEPLTRFFTQRRKVAKRSVWIPTPTATCETRIRPTR